MKNQKDSKKIILTFDYELFMGQSSGTVDNCLLKPTDEILRILKKNNAKAIFFVDATFLSLLKEDNVSDFLQVKKQIQQMCHDGHSVELHIHPQWLDAYKTSDKEWGFKKTLRYRLDLFDKNQVEEIFKNSYQILQNIISEAGSQYQIKAFRAGGWCLPSFTILKPLFKELGLKYDLSVLPGTSVDNGIYQKYDYTLVPKNKPFWSFSTNVCHEEAGEFLEIPCTMVKFNRLDLVFNKLQLKKQKVLGDGVGAYYKKGRLDKLKTIFLNPYKPLTLDGYLDPILLKLISKMRLPLVTLVGHPKSFGELNFKALDKLTENYQTVLLKDLKV